MLEEVVAVRLAERGIDQQPLPIAGRCRLHARPVHDRELYRHTWHAGVGTWIYDGQTTAPSRTTSGSGRRAS